MKIEKVPNDEYIVLTRPLFDCEIEEASKDDEGESGEENEEDEEETAINLYNQANTLNDGYKKMLEPARDYPDWKWVGLMESWKIFVEWRRRSNYCQPDYLNMYIFNDL